MTKIIIILISVVVFLSSCEKALDLGDRSFVGATRIGDSFLGKLNKDRIALTLVGKDNGTISGKLIPIKNHDKTVFTLKERPDLQMALGADGLIVFATKDGGSQFGVGLMSQRKAYVVSEVAGMYNFVLQFHSENQQKFGFGTFELGSDYSWRSWRFVNGSQGEEKLYSSGHWVDGGKGEISAFSADNKLYATVALSENSNLMVVSLVAKNGLALGVKQQTLMQGDINGDYTLLGTKGKIKKAYLAEKVIFKMNKDPNTNKRGNEKLILTYNKPWSGFFTDKGGEILGICSKKGDCFCLNLGTITREQYVVVAIKKK